jgi:hypothetical protein
MTDKKSTVNKAGNYTKPTMRKNLFNKIKAGSKGGRFSGASFCTLRSV